MLNSFDGHDPIRASEHQLMEAKVSINKLHLNSLILLDDKVQDKFINRLLQKKRI